MAPPTEAPLLITHPKRREMKALPKRIPSQPGPGPRPYSDVPGPTCYRIRTAQMIDHVSARDIWHALELASGRLGFRRDARVCAHYDGHGPLLRATIADDDFEADLVITRAPARMGAGRAAA